MFLFATGDQWHVCQAAAYYDPQIRQAAESDPVDIERLEHYVLALETPDSSRSLALESLYSVLTVEEFEEVVTRALPVAAPGGRMWNYAAQALLYRPSASILASILVLTPHLQRTDMLAALAFLEWSNEPEAIELMNQLSQHHDPYVALEAMEGLLRSRPFWAIEETMVRCLSHRHYSVVVRAIISLGEHGGPHQAAAISEAVRGFGVTRQAKDAAAQALELIAKRGGQVKS